jgi:hypothetical protein
MKLTLYRFAWLAGFRLILEFGAHFRILPSHRRQFLTQKNRETLPGAAATKFEV